MLVCYNAINIEINNKIRKSMLGNKKWASEQLESMKKPSWGLEST